MKVYNIQNAPFTEQMNVIIVEKLKYSNVAPITDLLLKDLSTFCRETKLWRNYSAAIFF